MGEIFVGCVMCDVKMLKKDCTRKWERSINMKGYYKNDSEKVLTLGITIGVLIKDFGEGKLSDDKLSDNIFVYVLIGFYWIFYNDVLLMKYFMKYLHNVKYKLRI